MPDQELTIQFLRDLIVKVDALPDRNEIRAIVDGINQRITVNEDKIAAVSLDTEELKRSRLPSWLAPVGTALSTVFAGGALYVALTNGHPNAQAAPITSQSTSSTLTTTQQGSKP